MKPSNSLQNLNQKNKPEEEIPERYRSVLRSENYSGSFSRVESWLRNKTSENQKTKPERSLTKMKNYLFSHKFRIAYAVIFLAVIVAACNMPVTTHEPMGNVIAWTIPAGNPTSASLIDGLSWVDRSKLNVNTNEDNGKSEILYTLTLPGSTPEQVDTYKKDLERIKDVTSIKIIPLNADVKRPLYSAALYNFFRININATNMSDAEVQQEITTKLKEAGINNPNIEFKTDEHGRRLLKMNIPEDQMKNSNGNFELRVNDDGNQEVMKMVHNELEGDKLKGKTDQEIREYVKQKNPELNLKDSEIKITHEGDNVKIRVEREELEK